MSGTALVTWFGATFFGIWIGLAIAQIATGRFLFRMFNPALIDWSANEIKLSGLAFAICGIVGAGSVLFFGLFAPFPPRIAWIVVLNPWALVFIAALFVQLLIELHHRRRWPFKRAPESGTKPA